MLSDAGDCVFDTRNCVNIWFLPDVVIDRSHQERLSVSNVLDGEL